MFSEVKRQKRDLLLVIFKFKNLLICFSAIVKVAFKCLENPELSKGNLQGNKTAIAKLLYKVISAFPHMNTGKDHHHFCISTAASRA